MSNHFHVLKHIRVARKWTYAAVVRQDGAIVPDQVVVRGVNEYHPEGKYYIEWYEHGRRRRHVVPPSANIEDAARQTLCAVKEARAQAEAEGRTIGAAIEQYLKFIGLHRSHRTWLAYRRALTMFKQCYRKPNVDQVQRKDLINFMSCCYERGLGSRTVYAKLVTVLQFFKMHGKDGLLQPSDWPKYVEAIRPSYEPEEIRALLQHAYSDERVLLMFLLASGLRDREFQCLWWRDIDLHNCLVRVTAKPSLRFWPKSWEERAVPLPRILIGQLAQIKQNRNATPTQLVFPNSKGKPQKQGNAILKSIAWRGGLNCGQCVTKFGHKCAEGPYCRNFYLHKFRHTFATEHLRDGVDICTLQKWMGHHDIHSTMKYVRGLVTEQAVAKVSAGWLSAHIGADTIPNTGSISCNT